MKKPTLGAKNMLTLHVKDELTLYNSYLPFLKRGGLFFPTDKKYELGEEVFLKLTLLNDEGTTPVAGKVAWINPKGAPGGRPAGIGVHFNEMDNGKTRERIEQAIVAMLKSEKPTYTM
ncbi:Tfp pilus assembly protein PilZ [Beggiatoa alba B18LD]|uniref:Tfp pilus assembly protein PilZ n=1 Tax=Beggiatoa alba B18LD TaxID=395493 RepID=I3CCC6_9GAMM|nr:PilZ domain-containing protein [Beggiatoa alba]EIJ41269.1 Tfp pilus assembly protein PilZ [Beggiatoa alba B18LD]